MTGAAIRVGMITPSSNTCLEPATAQLLAGTTGVSAHFSRLGVTRIALDDSSDAQFSLDAMAAAAELLADARVDSVIWNGTSGSWLGTDQDRAVVGRIEKVAGVPATTSTLALLEACAAYGVTRLGLATPYTADVNELIVRRYASEGIEVVAESHLGLTDNHAFAQIPQAEVATQLRSVAEGAHAVAAVCTNVHGFQVAAQLEPELGIPVLDSVAVSLWESLRLAGHDGHIPGFGTLLDAGSLRAGLQAVTDELLDATGADRTTLRLDVPEHGLVVDLTTAESLRPGTRSIRRDSSLDQRRLNTVQWLEAHRTDLVQPHFRQDPLPPQALVEVYGVTAQMLGPIQGRRSGDTALVGWLSVHSLSEREWTTHDVAALDSARADVERLLGLAG
jgi:maleate isomerase